MRMRSVVIFTGMCTLALILSVVTADEKVAADKPGGFKLEFAGRNSCVIVPKLRYPGTHPITLEAIVTPHEQIEFSRGHSVVGNIEQSGVAIHYLPDAWVAFYNDGRESDLGYVAAGSDGVPVLNTQVHIAAVFDGKKIRMFLNGKLQQADDAPANPHKSSMLDFMVGADPNFNNFPSHFFKGTIDEVRISKVARYTDNFTPPKEKFVTDPSTMLLYHFDEGEGQVTKDSSGNKYDGIILGAKWVKEN